MNTNITYKKTTKLPTSNFIFFCLKGFKSDFALPEYDIIIDNLSVYNGVLVSKYISLTIIEQLKTIPYIIVLEAMEGRSIIQPTYLLIHLTTDNKDEIQNFVNLLNENVNVRSNFEYDVETKLHRIGITTNLFVMDNPEKYKEWWEELPTIITNVIHKLNY